MMNLLNKLTGYHRVPDLYLLGITAWLFIGYAVCLDISRSLSKKDSSPLKAYILFIVFSVWVGIFCGLRFGYYRNYTVLAERINLAFMLLYPFVLFGVTYNTQPGLAVWGIGYFALTVCTLFMPGMRSNAALWGRVFICGLVFACYAMTYLLSWLIWRSKKGKKEDK